jgi:dienelactone hydrolase
MARPMDIDALAGYEIDEFAHGGTTRTVLRTGTGPAVIIMAEMPGITPRVADFGRRVATIGCTAVLPSLFGTPGRRATPGYLIRSLAGGCVSREFTAFLRRRTSPVTDWLRALAAFEHGRCGGPGVGAVGMCFTGGFALGMMVDRRMLAPVLSQPSLPLPIGGRRRRSLGISNRDLEIVRERVRGDRENNGDDAGICVLGLRFSEDSMAPAERFDRLAEEFGDGFIGVEIDSSPGNEHRISKRAHSVLTDELVDEPGHPTRDALDAVLEHLRVGLLA